MLCSLAADCGGPFCDSACENVGYSRPLMMVAYGYNWLMFSDTALVHKCLLQV